MRKFIVRESPFAKGEQFSGECIWTQDIGFRVLPLFEKEGIGEIFKKARAGTNY